MKKRNRWKTIVAAVLFTGCIVSIALLYGKAAEWEKQQNRLIQDLETANEELREQITAVNDMAEALRNELVSLEARINGPSAFGTDGYHYLAIGNSITVHGKCDYWWSETGMAATEGEKDYFHLVTAYLEETYGETAAYAYNFGNWELLNTDRAEALALLDAYLIPDMDLVTIQLSENVKDTTTFKTDFSYLIQYIAEKCPTAQIIVIDDFWSSARSALKREAVEGCGVLFVDLNEIRGKEEYQCGYDTIVYGDDGTAHTVTHSGVASHPGDAAMEYIADAVIAAIE